MAKGKPIIKTEEEIEIMRESCLLVSKTLAEVGKHIVPGISTFQLDAIAEEFILDNGAIPAFKDYKPYKDVKAYPYTLCTSVNEEVVHGMPSKTRILQEGDIISVDCGVVKNGFVGDSAYTFPVGIISPKKKRLLEATKQSLYKGIQRAVTGNFVGDISNAVQLYVESLGYSVVREMVGHGVGKDLHEAPEVPNYGRRRTGELLRERMVIAIEPMINMGKAAIKTADDEWTVYASDRHPSAHFEHTVVIRTGKAEILTTFEFIEASVNS